MSRKVLEILNPVIDHDKDNMLEAFGIAVGEEGTEELARLVRKTQMVLEATPTKSLAVQAIVNGDVFNEEDTRVITLFFMLAGVKDIIKMNS